MGFVFVLCEVVLFAVIALYVYWKSGKFITFYRGDAKKRTARLIRAGIAAVAGVLGISLRHTCAIIVIHIVVIFGVFDLLAKLVRLPFREKEGTLYRILRFLYASGLVPVLILALVFSYGFSNMWYIREQQYTVTTVKQVSDYRIALLTDIHYGTIQAASVVQDMADRISEQKPDLVILAGDIVEEGTSKEEMQEIFRVLGNIDNTYGCYYVYGNHDKQPYTTDRTYTDEELEQAIQGSGIQILKDQYVKIGDDLILAGRDDAAWGNTSGRKSTEELLSGISEEEKKERYVIVADHQPIESEENSGAGVDLQLSGHTHAGQIWPIGYFTEMAGTLNYGEYLRGQCKVAVSSGVAGWGYAFRTQEHCEYVTVQLKSQ